ncbi:MAG TPA: nuclear transport factor 2 family protein [Terracidiphilus sp.]|nr:nuclear transport factor 2 family protein [Terracidiphilus sp.]
MKRYAVLFLSTMALLAAARLAHAQCKDEQAIRALEDQFAAAFRAKDLNAIMKVYAPGNGIFVFDVSTPREYSGYDAYKNDWAKLFDGVQGPIQFYISELAITCDGNLAFSHSIQHVSYAMKDGTQSEMIARVTDDYRKIGGKWLIVQEHVSVPIDFATGKPDMMSKP